MRFTQGKESFGETTHGEAITGVAIAAGSLSARILSWGAVVQDLRLDGHDAPLVLGFDDLASYIEHNNYFGAVAGRYANRIRAGRFSLGGREFSIDPDHPERHGLHGGPEGYARRNWEIAGSGSDFVTLSLADRDGTMGFPGSLDIQCTYRIKMPGTLSVEFTATTDELTLCNLAQHSYFNLDDGGAGDILRHRMLLNADAYLPVDDELIPTGEVLPVDATPFDLRDARAIGLPGDIVGRYDHNFCLSSARGAIRQAALVSGADSGVEMEVWTTEPGVQFYTGQYIAPHLTGLDGRRYNPGSGFCLEPQVWPDSPNRPYFPQAVLRPGEVYRADNGVSFSQDAGG